jgi:pilus assembly protein CpaB
MNRSRFLVLAAISLVFSLAVSLYIYRYAQAASKTSSEPMFEAMVAATDLQIGTRIEKKDIRVVRVPLNALPQNSPRKMVEVIGRGVVLPIPEGQFILLPELADENAGSGLPSLIPSDMRAISVRVNDVTSVDGFVTPGTRVDVFMTATRNGEAQTIRVLQNVAVLASGHTIERSTRGEPQGASVATLLVSTSDAEKLILASNEGRIQLALRNPVDTRPGETDRGQTLQQLYSGSQITEPIKHKKRPALVMPTPVSLPQPHEIQIYPGNGPVQVIKCQDGGTCSQGKN